MNDFNNLRWINIEPIGHCQLRCPHCPRDPEAREQSPMARGLFLHLLEQVPERTEVRLFLSGEPFLDKDIGWRVEQVRAANRKMLIHTNACALRKDRVAHVMSAGGPLLTISVSVDGRDRQQYEEMRPPAKFDQVQAGCEMLVAAGRIWRDPILVLQTIRLAPEPLEINRDIAYMEAEFDKVWARWPHNWDLAESVQGSVTRNYPPVCDFLKLSMAVQCDGLVTRGCCDLNGKGVVADSRAFTLREIWETEIRRLRDGQGQGTYEGMCRGCERGGARATG